MTNEQPHRVQLRRVRGWKLPPNTVAVTRPGRFGNPFRVGSPGAPTAAAAVALFQQYLEGQPALLAEARTRLRGKNVACFCPLNAPCHGDALLQLANT